MRKLHQSIIYAAVHITKVLYHANNIENVCGFECIERISIYLTYYIFYRHNIIVSIILNITFCWIQIFLILLAEKTWLFGTIFFDEITFSWITNK